MSQLSLLILAAGIGRRYGGLKQIAPIGPNGETILDYSVYDARQAGFDQLVFVIRRDIETAFRETIGRQFEPHIPVKYAYQEVDSLPAGFDVAANRQKPWGTGHAVWVAASLINQPFAVINADDFYGPTSYKLVADYLTTGSPHYALVGFKLRNTLSDFGSVARGICQTDAENFVQSVTEITNIEKAGQQARYVDATGQPHTLSGEEIASMNMWGFRPTIFAQLHQHLIEFLHQPGNHQTAEFYLPSAVNNLITHQQAQVKMLPSPDSWFGMTYQQDKKHVVQSIQNLITAGVYPAKLFS